MDVSVFAVCSVFCRLLLDGPCVQNILLSERQEKREEKIYEKT